MTVAYTAVGGIRAVIMDGCRTIFYVFWGRGCWDCNCWYQDSQRFSWDIFRGVWRGTVQVWCSVWPELFFNWPDNSCNFLEWDYRYYNRFCCSIRCWPDRFLTAKSESDARKSFWFMLFALCWYLAYRLSLAWLYTFFAVHSGTVGLWLTWSWWYDHCLMEAVV